MGTRDGPGDDRDDAFYARLVSPNGMRSLFVVDRLPTLMEVNIAFAHVWQGHGHEQGYLLAELVDPVFLSSSRAPVLACQINCWMLLSPGLMVV